MGNTKGKIRGYTGKKLTNSELLRRKRSREDDWHNKFPGRVQLTVMIVCFVLFLVIWSCDADARWRQKERVVEPDGYKDIKRVEYVRNYDGDTVTVNIHKWPALVGHEIPIRVAGVDTPEIYGDCDKEKSLARITKAFVEIELTNARRISILNPERGKYFRIVGDIVYDGKSLTKELLERGYGVPYDGGTKENPWCEEKVLTDLTE